MYGQGRTLEGCRNLQLLPGCGHKPWMYPQQCALWLLDERSAGPGSAVPFMIGVPGLGL